MSLIALIQICDSCIGQYHFCVRTSHHKYTTCGEGGDPFYIGIDSAFILDVFSSLTAFSNSQNCKLMVLSQMNEFLDSMHLVQ